jgi:putative DNA primase/helicase
MSENPDPEKPNPDAEVERLAALPRLEYDRIRQETAKRLKVRVATLDAEVEKRRQAEESRGSSHTLDESNPSPDPDRRGILEPVTPWHEPVDGGAVLSAIRDTILRFVVMPEGAAETVALFVVFAHAHDAGEHSPILAIESPEKRCGKTTLLNIIGQLVPVPLPAANITTASIFRAIDKFRPTLLMDEVETYIRDNEEMRGVLNSGFTRQSAFVIRTVGDDHEPTPFSTWCPKVGALIGKLPDTLQDRSIVLTLRRRLGHEKSERFAQRHHPLLHELRSKAARWAIDYLEQLCRAEPTMPDGLNDRAEDAWRPLLAIADVAGRGWPKLGRKAAVVLSGKADDELVESAGAHLLVHIRELFATQELSEIASKRLVDLLNENEQWPWGEWRQGKPITPHGVSKILKRYGIAPRKREDANKYIAADFQDAWDRYAASAPQGTPAQTSRTSSRDEKRRGAKGLTGPAAEPQTSSRGPRLENRKCSKNPANTGVLEVLEVSPGETAGGKRLNGHRASADSIELGDGELL